MKFKFSKKQMTWGMTAFLVIAAGILFYFLVFEFRNIIKSIQGIMDSIAPVLYGVVIAYILSPVLNFIEHYLLKPIFNRFGASTSLPFLTADKKFKTMRTIAVTLSIATWIGLLAVVIFFLVPQLITSVMEISRNIPRYINNVTIISIPIWLHSPKRRSWRSTSGIPIPTACMNFGDRRSFRR